VVATSALGGRREPPSGDWQGCQLANHPPRGRVSSRHCLSPCLLFPLPPATQDPTIAEEVEAIVQALYEQPNHNKLYPEQIVILTGGDLKGGGFSGWHGLGTLQAAVPPITSTYLPTCQPT
jgi:hypothetical protein